MAATFQVGQKVIVTHPEHHPVETEVTKVGRTLVYARGQAFHMDTGMERRHPNAGGYGSRILTPAQYAEQQERVRLRGALSKAGIKFADFHASEFTTDQLRRLLAIALEGNPQPES